jgi:hypothetical protein
MRLRFSIRGLLWLTLAVAVVAGWLVERSHRLALPDIEFWRRLSGERNHFALGLQNGDPVSPSAQDRAGSE